MHCVRISLGEYQVHSAHDATPDVVALTLRALSKANEVIDEDINMCNRPQKGLQGGTVARLWQRPRSG